VAFDLVRVGYAKEKACVWFVVVYVVTVKEKRSRRAKSKGCVMFKPVVCGEVWSTDSELRTFKDKVTGDKREYAVRGVELLVREPVRATMRIGLIGEDVLSAAIKEGVNVKVELSSFNIEKNVSVCKALPADFKVIK
jgi:hypothetical protein